MNHEEYVELERTYNNADKTISLKSGRSCFGKVEKVSVLIIFDKAIKDDDEGMIYNEDTDDYDYSDDYNPSDNFNDHLEIVAYNYYDARERQQCYVELNNILIDGYVLQYKEMILI